MTQNRFIWPKHILSHRNNDGASAPLFYLANAMHPLCKRREIRILKGILEQELGMAGLNGEYTPE